jgi:hypothetical protein
MKTIDLPNEQKCRFLLIENKSIFSKYRNLTNESQKSMNYLYLDKYL